MCGLANLGSGDMALRAPSRHSRLVCRVGLWWSYLMTPQGPPGWYDPWTMEKAHILPSMVKEHNRGRRMV